MPVARRAQPSELEEPAPRGQGGASGLSLEMRGSDRMISAFNLNAIPYWVEFNLHDPAIDGAGWEGGRQQFRGDVRSWARVSFWLNGSSTLVPKDIRAQMRTMTPTQLGKQVLKYGNPSELYGVFHEILVRFVKKWDPQAFEYIPPDPSNTRLDDRLIRRLPGAWTVTKVGDKYIAERSGLRARPAPARPVQARPDPLVGPPISSAPSPATPAAAATARAMTPEEEKAAWMAQQRELELATSEDLQLSQVEKLLEQIKKRI